VTEVAHTPAAFGYEGIPLSAGTLLNRPLSALGAPRFDEFFAPISVVAQENGALTVFCVSPRLCNDSVIMVPPSTGRSSAIDRIPFPNIQVGTIDVGPLLHDVLRTVRRPTERTRLFDALHHGYTRVFTTPDVVAAVRRRLPGHATNQGVEQNVAVHLWEHEYLPHLSVVDVDDLSQQMSLDPDVALLHSRDANDTGLGILSALLGVRAWTEDNDHGELGTGRGLWLQHLLATVDTGKGEMVAFAGNVATIKTIEVAAHSAMRAYRWSEARIGKPATIGVSILLAALAVWFLSAEDRRRWLGQTPAVRGLGDVAGAGLGAVSYVSRQNDEARGFLKLHRREDLRPPTAEVRIARLLARTPVPPMSTSEIAAKAVISEPVVETIAHDHAAFVQMPDGRWQLGSRPPRPAPPRLIGHPVQPTWHWSAAPAVPVGIPVASSVARMPPALAGRRSQGRSRPRSRG